MNKNERCVLWLIPLTLLFLIFNGCSLFKPEESKITIDLQTTSGAPGTVINFTTSKDIGPDEGVQIQIGTQTMVLFPAGDPKLFSTAVPVMDPGSIKVVLIKKDKEYSNSVSFTVMASQPTGFAPGQIAHEVVNDQDFVFNALAQDFLPQLRYTGQMTVANSNAFGADIQRARDFQNKMRTLINQLSPSDKTQLDQLFINSGVYDLSKSLKKATIDASKDLNSMAKNSYEKNHLCLALDGFSAILSVLDKLMTIVGLVGALPSGGSLPAIAALGSVTINIIDGGIDAFVPTDLDEIWVEGTQPIIVPLGGDADVVVMGRFVTQSEPAGATISVFVSTLLTIIGMPGMKSFVLNTFVTLGINIAEPMNNMVENWQTIDFIKCRIDPALYVNGVTAFTQCMASAVGLFIPNTFISDFIGLITGTSFQAANSDIATFNSQSSMVHGLQAGTTDFKYNGYRFKPLFGIWSIMGFDYPAHLNRTSIHPCSFKVEAATANTLRLTSTPSQAEIFFNGNETGLLTPATLPLPYAGAHVLRFVKSGYNDYVAAVNTVEGGTYAIDASLSQQGYPRPLITINSPANYSNYYDNVITVSGTVGLQDSYGGLFNYSGTNAVINVNGNDSELNVNNGFFSQAVSIAQGANEIYVGVTTDGGVTGTSTVCHVNGEFTIAPIEAVITWNTPTSDLDIHVWNPANEHCYYGHMNISGGSLDIDDVEGYGPETFTTSWLQQGLYYFAINCYSLDQDDYSDASLRLFLNGQETNYGPHRFTVDDFNGSNSAAWWNVATVNVTAKGPIIGGVVPPAMLAKIKEDIRNLPVKN